MVKCFNDNKGMILLGVLSILLTISLIGATLGIFFSSLNISVNETVNKTKAYYLAEAGIAHAVFFIRNQQAIINNEDGAIGPVTLGEGSYTVILDYSQSLIISTGDVYGTKKTLQLQYVSL